MDFFRDYVKDMCDKVSCVDLAMLNAAKRLIHKANRKGGKVIISGNGGSASIASHVSVDLTKNTGIQAINFNEADLITCLSNDYGYERWIEKALEFYARENDIVILISSSGQSENIINAARKARGMNLDLVTFSGFKPENPLRTIGDINFWVDSNSYNVVEMTHHIWLLAIVDKIVKQLNVSYQNKLSETISDSRL